MMLPVPQCSLLISHALKTTLCRSEWESGFKPDRNEGLVWFIDSSETNNGNGARSQERSVVPYTTLFQAIRAHATENMNKIIKISTFYQTVKLGLNHLNVIKWVPSWSGIAVNTLLNFLNMTAYSWYGCMV
jgi:hypothetical protein